MRAAIIVGAAFAVDATRSLVITAQPHNASAHISAAGDQADLLALIGSLKLAIGAVATILLFLSAQRWGARPGR